MKRLQVSTAMDTIQTNATPFHFHIAHNSDNYMQTLILQ